MNRLGDARQRLYDAIAPALPGRVNPYPLPHVAVGTAPYVWIEQPRLGVASTPGGARVIVAAFPIWVVYDGAVHAQVAGLDDVVAAVWDACEADADIEPRSVEPRDLAVEAPTASAPNEPPPHLRASVVTAAVTIHGRTLCRPDVTAATIPPELVEVTA